MGDKSASFKSLEEANLARLWPDWNLSQRAVGQHSDYAHNSETEGYDCRPEVGGVGLSLDTSVRRQGIQIPEPPAEQGLSPIGTVARLPSYRKSGTEFQLAISKNRMPKSSR